MLVPGMLTFGEFELSMRRRTLTRSGRRVRLGSRAMDILLLLAEQPGELVTKEQIAGRLWPSVFVEEATIRVHVSSLRKALGTDADGRQHIHTVAGRGYIFVSPLAATAEPEGAAARDMRSILPIRVERLIGRTTAVDSIARQVLEHRFVTVVGPGGIGKTSVALEAAAHLADEFPDGVRFVDLATLDNSETAAGALAIALGLPTSCTELSPRALAGPLTGKHLLVVLDNCERLAGAAAVIGETLLRSASGVCVLATSREALRADGEWLHRLPPLATPTSVPTTAAAAMKYSAIELFVARADAASGGYRLDAGDCACVIEICRRLDGLPLAIELAATTVATLGVRGVAAGLDDRLSMLTGGKRTAQARHQTLRAAFDWSYDLLASEERAVLDRLSVIAGAFDLSLARAVASGPGAPPAEVQRLVLALSTKSLISLEINGDHIRYRLLESTRVYATEKLAESAEAVEAWRRYAQATLVFFSETAAGWATTDADDWLALHAARLEDARAVLEWAFSETGDRALGRTLVVDLCSIWLRLGLARECASWCRKAMARDPGADADQSEMKIQHAFALAHGSTYGNDNGNRAAGVASLAIARRLDNHDYIIRNLWGLSALEMNAGNIVRALDYARQLSAAASGATNDVERLVGQRLIGSALHLLGRHKEAGATLEALVGAFDGPGRQEAALRFHYDQVVMTKGYLAWVRWVQGDTAGSRRMADDALEEATRVDHAGSLGFALDTAGSLAVLRGDIGAASRASHQLAEMGAHVTLNSWATRNDILSALILVKAGDLSAGVPKLQAALTPSNWHFATYGTPFFLCELAQAEAAFGQWDNALATIDAAIGWYGGGNDFWCAPECLRTRAEILAQAGGFAGAREAHSLLRHALGLARSQGAAAWEQRICISMRHHRAGADQALSGG